MAFCGIRVLIRILVIGFVFATLGVRMVCVVYRMAVRIVKHAFELIFLTTGKNPIQVCVDAIANSGPREDSTRIGNAGVVRRQSCDVVRGTGIYNGFGARRSVCGDNHISVSACWSAAVVGFLFCGAIPHSQTKCIRKCPFATSD